jgi:hypothetical protein
MIMAVLKLTLVVATVKECTLVEVVIVHSDRCSSMPDMTSDSETARDESLLKFLTKAISRRPVQECYSLGSHTCNDCCSYSPSRKEGKAACASKVNAPLGVRRLVRLGLGSSWWKPSRGTRQQEL